MKLILIITICFYTTFSIAKGQWGRLKSIVDLERNSKRDKDYEIVSWYRPGKPMIIAVHGGNIESGSGELAEMVAGRDWSLYHFKGITAPDYDGEILQSGYMHLTSHKFSEPLALEMTKKAPVCLSLHGFPAKKHKVDFCVGGKNEKLRKEIVKELSKKFPRYKSCELCCPPYLGMHDENIVNRCKKFGVQIEMSPKVRRKIMFSSDYFSRDLGQTLRKVMYR